MKRVSLLALLLTSPLFAQTPDFTFFEQKIRPVLIEHCYACHSADAVKNKKLRGGLRLDTAQGLRTGGDSGPAVIPGKIKKGHLLEALRYTGDVKMPPKKQLPAEVVADFQKWIEMGAPDPRDESAAVAVKKVDVEKGRTWWSFQPLKHVQPPKVKNEKWTQGPIDRFILAPLEAKGIVPNGPIDRERLLRRVYFDLIGLPPTPAEIDAFASDSAPDAFAKVVDRLLENPAYGERWARHWLDTVRFAESSGYEFDKDRPGAYHYRDFVIDALNKDMPYDEFVRLQIAGDHLQASDMKSIAATGFLVAGPYPGQVTQKTLSLIRYNHLDDMVSTLGSSMLGLSVGCARCHDHKYDPIPQHDYYRLLSALGRTDSIERKVNPTPDIYRKAKDAFDVTMKELQAERVKFEKDELLPRLQTWRKEHPHGAAPAWLILDPQETPGLKRQGDAFTFTAGKPNKDETFTFSTLTFQKNLSALRFEALGTGVLQVKEIMATAQAYGKPKTSQALKFDAAAWTPTDDKKEHAKVFAFATPVAGFEGGTTLTVTVTLKSAPTRKLRWAVATSLAAADAPSALQNLFEIPLALDLLKQKPDALPLSILGRWHGRTDPETNNPYRLIAEHEAKEPQPNLIGIFSASSGKGGDVHFLIRGEVERKNGIATPGFLQVMMNAEQKEKTWLEPSKEPRVALAHWLTDTKVGAGNLLARVLVNRLWQHHMGRGIVATPNDFGIQGDAPTHPELLEWLAHELVQDGWKLKGIHKKIVQSSAYQQAGDLLPTGMKLDPQNKLWWRQAPKRLEAETIRDALLAVSGTLDPRAFGPGSLDPENPRRSIYLTVKRSKMVPMMQMFDAPEPIQSIGERSITTVPTQALAFMNSGFVRTRAEKLALRAKQSTIEAGIREAYRLALGRSPSEADLARMAAFVQSQASTDRAMVEVCQVLLCLNEFVYVD